ncbi:putative leucine-rich repeat domain, L domain-containing protein [Medicago truncatula]|uniref:Putative leucine-rich repeat domain, L domain-containing protein n=1 Tax=Medicago truncatula TaxID=3880 RepID=A0A396HXB8_MEDTR|nr:putative leucine-rich repeat domain, L domain-containing protein [Medicago truncatula]
MFVTSHFVSCLVSLKYLTCLDLFSLNISDEMLSSIAMQGFLLTRWFSLQNCTGFSYAGIFCLLSKCEHIQLLDLQNIVFLNHKHVVELSSFLGDLVSINLNHCSILTESAFFALLKNCPSLCVIKMEHTCIGK